jgi:YD repeat-containing protein
VRKIGPDGRLQVAAGSGTLADTGDGGPATAAAFFSPGGLALGADGGLFIADFSYHRVRRVGPEGAIAALAGRQVLLNNPGPYLPTEDAGPATAAALQSPSRIAVSPDGSLYISDLGHQRVRRVQSPLPGFAALGDIVVASSDGGELYVFTSRGRHLRTVDALTTAVRHQFAYDAEGRLEGVTDVDGRALTITRPTANTVVLTGPDDQATTLTLDAHGYVAAIAGPAGTTSFASTDAGLITTASDANGHARTFTYGADGRLGVAADPPGSGGSDTLVRSPLSVPNGTGYQVTHTTADGVATTHQVAFEASGVERRTTLHPDGTQSAVVIAIDGGRTITQPDGTTQTTTIGPDPRFGLQAPVTTEASVATPDGLSATLTASRTASLSTPTDPLSLTTQTDTLVVNNRPPATSTYNAATRVTTDTTPAGRQTQTTVDAKGRVSRVQAANLHPLRLAYDTAGRPTQMQYGPDPDTSQTLW